ncbi:hypothetical protein L2E82_30732 [Cichorium intybus]|uniref:Uncharacterized protein n=1 Tax=Cichorium intybus TaxID=13427 RepID=A0ACB9D142_CICIN|nr:hypothetical protein L2E82_30732 [Cichorium intybus]
MMADKRGIRKLLKELPYFHGVVICKLILDGVQDYLPRAVMCRVLLDEVQGSLAGAVMCNLVLESRSSLVGTGIYKKEDGVDGLAYLQSNVQQIDVGLGV